MKLYFSTFFVAAKPGINVGFGEGDRKPGVSFINILQTGFLYESVLHTFYVITVWVGNCLARRNSGKTTEKLRRCR